MKQDIEDEKQRPFFSVIIPVFNVKPYLESCLESVVLQTFGNYEVIIVDDGSTDGSSEICADYMKRYNQIKLIVKENGGLSDARNTGIDNAIGEYILFLDGDDFISHVLLEVIHSVISDTGAELIALRHPVAFWDGEDYAVCLADKADSHKIEYKDSKDVLEAMLYLDIPTGAPFKIVKRALLCNIRFPKGYLYEDLATTYKLFFLVNKVAVLEGEFYAYRKRENSIIRQGFSDKKKDILDVTRWIIEDMDSKCPELSTAVRYRCFSPLYSVFLQTPSCQTEIRNNLWQQVKDYRRSVIKRGFRARKKDIVGMLVSFLGRDVAYCLGNKFGRKDTVKE